MPKKDYIQTNVILMCDKGVAPTPFIATPKMQNHHGMTGGTIRDNLPLLNILSFGVCSVTRTPCIPVMPTWENYPISPCFIEGFQPLLLSSQAICKLGGTIKIYTSYPEVIAANPDKPKSWKDALLSGIDSAIGTAMLMPFSPVLELCGKGDIVQSVGEFGRGVVQGIGKGLASTVEGLYNMVAHPIDTVSGIAKLAGTAIVGYSNPGMFGSPEERLKAFDSAFGTDLSQVDAGIKKSLSDTGDKLMRGTNEERGEVVGQAIEFIAEIVVGTKGAGAATKVAKGGAEAAEIADEAAKVTKITKATDEAVKAEKLGELSEATKGIYGKKELPKLPENATAKQKGNFGEIASHNNKVDNPLLKEKGYDLERIGKDAPSGVDDKIKKGIDGIYKNNTPPPKYVIDEAKFGSSQLGTTKDGIQMSDDWVKGSKRLEKQVGKEEARKIENAMKKGEVEKVVSKVGSDGTVKTYKVDAKGNISNPWP